MTLNISVGMIDAGAKADADFRSRPESARIAAIFAAMYEVWEVEEARRVNPNHERPAYRHQSWPAWRQGPDGARRIFEKAEDVPEGWGPVGAAPEAKPAKAKRGT